MNKSQPSDEEISHFIHSFRPDPSISFQTPKVQLVKAIRTEYHPISLKRTLTVLKKVL